MPRQELQSAERWVGELGQKYGQSPRGERGESCWTDCDDAQTYKSQVVCETTCVCKPPFDSNVL